MSFMHAPVNPAYHSYQGQTQTIHSCRISKYNMSVLLSLLDNLVKW